MMGHQGQSLLLNLSLLILIVGVAVAEDVSDDKVMIKESEKVEGNQPISQQQLKSEEFRLWIEEQENRVVYKIMEKISSPNDTIMQHAAKIAVARYLVNVTFTAMTRRLETLKSGKKQDFIPETAAASHPASAVVPETTGVLIMMHETANVTEISNSTDTNSTTENSTRPNDIPEEVLMFKVEEGSSNDTSLPSSSAMIAFEFPVSSTLEEQSTMTSTSTNETETTTVSSTSSKPIWEEILTFNFSAALMGGGDGGGLLSRLMGGEGGSGSLLSRLNLTGLGGGGEGGGTLFNRLNLTSLGGAGGGSLFDRLNLTALGGGGEGGNLFERLNLTGLGGGEGGASLFDRLNLTALGGGGERGASIFERLNLTALGGGAEGGGLLSRFNLSSLSGGGGSGGLLSRLNFSASEGGEGGLPFSIQPPPEGLFNYPTPPPKNDSVRMSQMLLGNQIEKLMGDVSATNLTGIVESTINIATPSTVGVLVNALLNLVLCNPLDRFNGNCGVE